MSSSHSSSHKSHASDRVYLTIAAILTVITFIEVLYPIVTEGIYIFDLLFMPLLGIMSLGKFVLVVGFFMHLKFDPKCLSFILYFALIIALLKVVAFLFIFRVVV